MWETLKNAWKVPELRQKILYTMLLVFYWLASFRCPASTKNR